MVVVTVEVVVKNAKRETIFPVFLFCIRSEVSTERDSEPELRRKLKAVRLKGGMGGTFPAERRGEEEHDVPGKTSQKIAFVRQRSTLLIKST